MSALVRSIFEKESNTINNSQLEAESKSVGKIENFATKDKILLDTLHYIKPAEHYYPVRRKT